MNEPWGLPVAVPGVVSGVLDATGVPANQTGTTNIPDGYVGTIMLGASRVGTGGRTYSTISTTAFGTADTKTAALTLNKGVYLATALFFGVNPVASPSRLFIGFRIGGTAVVGQYASAILASDEITLNLCVPFVITTNGTEAACYGQTSAASAMTSCTTEMFIVRIG